MLLSEVGRVKFRVKNLRESPAGDSPAWLVLNA